MRIYKVFRAIAGAMGAGLLISASAPQAAPNVVASIKPVHSLVSAVMQNVGQPHLIVKGGASPHAFSLRPSDAAAIEQADLIFWVGPELELFLETPIHTLAPDALAIALAGTPGLDLLPIREGATFDAHDHQGEGHEDHEEHEHEHEAESHAHESLDMHIWLDPDNAILMVEYIADTLSGADPENADLYTANAEQTLTALNALNAEISAELQPVQGTPFMVFHDAYHYFENRFDVEAAGSITLSPEAIPGARRIAEVHDRMVGLDAACVFAEPQFEPSLIAVVIEGTNAKTGTLDPLGADLEDGPDLYFNMIRNMAHAMRDCLVN